MRALLLAGSLCLYLVLLSGCRKEPKPVLPVPTEVRLNEGVADKETNNIGVKALRRARDIKKKTESENKSLIEDFDL